jgi:hypothetical protein
VIFKTIISACLVIISVNVSAALISVDWKTPGDNLITRDTNSGLEWLDLTVTVERSANDIRSQILAGGEFEGWRFANAGNVETFFNAFGGFNVDPTTGASAYDGWSTINNGLFDMVAPMWGDLRCLQIGCAEGEGQSHFLIEEGGLIIDNGDGNIIFTTGWNVAGVIGDIVTDSRQGFQDLVDIEWLNPWPDYNETNPTVGSALIRNISSVPLPTALWLFGSGLLGLIGISRRKKA